MYSSLRPIWYLSVALSTATLLISTCSAQEIASLDLTKVNRRVDLRRPQATSPVTGGYSGTEQTTPCFDSKSKAGALSASLLSLDRTHYRLEDEPIFEVTVENAGFTTIRIPFSPHLADLQPDDPAKKFAYSQLNITLWIAAGDDRWSANTGGDIVLYGDDHHAGTMLSLNPGQWARVVGTGRFTLPGDPLKDEFIRLHPVGHVYAQASVYRDEKLITPTQSATVSSEVCIAQTHGQSVPIELVIP
jgi:hypothetical protein